MDVTAEPLLEENKFFCFQCGKCTSVCPVASYSEAFNPRLIIGIAILGVILGYIFLRTGNLFYSFLAHALYNFVSLMRVHMASEEMIQLGKVPAPPPYLILISFPVLLAGILALENHLFHSKKNGAPG